MNQSANFLPGIVIVICTVLAITTPLDAAAASEFKILYEFCTQQNCADGENPYSQLIRDRHGSIYGTTAGGGQYFAGTVFKLDTGGVETVLDNFCAGDCGRGSIPGPGLILDKKGQLYGTTEGGGHSDCATPNGCGTIFRLAPDGNEHALHRFRGYPDGAVPLGSLIVDSQGNFYGTTVSGGSGEVCAPFGGDIGCGTVFELQPHGVETVLYKFCSVNGCADGYAPYAGLIADGSGNLYGTTSAGGSRGGGTVFEIANGTESVLYNFCSQQSCVDGADPRAGLVMDDGGNFYGTTAAGGNNTASCSNGCGTVFKLAPDGTETVLYSFCANANCSDGAVPMATLVVDGNGNLFGTTKGGGDFNCGCGTVFEISPDGTETVLHAFRGAANNNGGDGAFPYAGLTTDSRGNFYGTTASGGVAGGGNSCGDSGCGTVFKIKP